MFFSSDKQDLSTCLGNCLESLSSLVDLSDSLVELEPDEVARLRNLSGTADFQSVSRKNFP